MREAGRSVAALVLTYCAPIELVRCVRSLQAQTVPPDEIIVIDNAGEPSAAETLLPLASPTLRVIRSERNLGPAGGHALGLEAFLRTNHDYAWILDDDVLAEPECLGALVAGVVARGGAVLGWPACADEHGSVITYPGWFGPLLPRRMVEQVGLPRADLFWWVEDTEYLQWRIPRAGFSSVRVEEARVRHEKGPTRPASAPWKTYYETRNSIYYRLWVQRGKRPLKLLRTVALIAGRSLRGPNRRSRLGLFSRGVVDGVLGRLGVRVTPPAPQRSS